MKKLSKKQLKKITKKIKKMKFMDKHHKQNFIKNLDIFEENLKNYTWWDYEFLNDFVITILKDMEKHYGVDSRIGGDIIKEKIQKILKTYEELNNIKEFYNLLGQDIKKFWD